MLRIMSDEYLQDGNSYSVNSKEEMKEVGRCKRQRENLNTEVGKGEAVPSGAGCVQLPTPVT
jgi:hypothetical protein